MKLILFLLTYTVTQQESNYYSITNNTTLVGVEYATSEELKCFIDTGTFNYFESCMHCYSNAEFIQF